MSKCLKVFGTFLLLSFALSAFSAPVNVAKGGRCGVIAGTDYGSCAAGLACAAGCGGTPGCVTHCENPSVARECLKDSSGKILNPKCLKRSDSQPATKAGAATVSPVLAPSTPKAK